ncbi:hypothetical protein NDU88_001875 [Pleurodeles waltl]|uniref:Uncharacterized protein n=1 Tax=Pleurodeles waltl TaxID=8319 RepID=A0AAV7T0V1_PLEWA|nr:hypothetical protein NDU88_001875 [Pleurodeles waltl]
MAYVYPARPLRSVIKQTITEVLAVAVGITRLIRLLSQTIIINMAPKVNRHLGDKSEGAKIARSGRGKGESAGLNKRLTSITGKAGGENTSTSGLMKDAKMSAKISDSTTSLLENKLKGNNQSTIMAFLAGGVQGASAANAIPSPENNWSGKGSTPLDSSMGNQDHCDKPIESPSENQDISREAIRKVLSLPGNGQLQIQQMEQGEQVDLQNKGRIGSPSGYTAEENDSTNPLGSPKKRDKIMGGENLQLTDWGRESSDKFYSPTEESDLSSADCSFSETDESETSETGNKSPSGEHTVRKARQRKFVKSHSGLQEGSESMAPMSGRTLRWDYSGIGLADTPTGDNQSPAKDKNGSDPGAAARSIGNSGNAHAMGTEAGILQSINSSIKELQMETRIESRRARVATKRLQGSVRKVAKSCMEIEAKLCSMEDRIVAVEDDMDTLKEQNSARDGQLTDVMWKIEDLENRQRRNNLRFLGIPEGLEGNNIQAYMVTLLRGAFPELGNRDWDNEETAKHPYLKSPEAFVRLVSEKIALWRG